MEAASSTQLRASLREPHALSNLIEMLLIFAIPAGFTATFGRMVREQSHGWTLFAS